MCVTSWGQRWGQSWAGARKGLEMAPGGSPGRDGAELGRDGQPWAGMGRDGAALAGMGQPWQGWGTAGQGWAALAVMGSPGRAGSTVPAWLSLCSLGCRQVRAQAEPWQRDRAGSSQSSVPAPGTVPWHQGSSAPWVPTRFLALAAVCGRLIILKAEFHPNSCLISWDPRKSEDQWKVLPLLNFQICFGT